MRDYESAMVEQLRIECESIEGGSKMLGAMAVEQPAAFKWLMAQLEEIYDRRVSAIAAAAPLAVAQLPKVGWTEAGK